MGKSIAETDSRSTICFPDDDDVELGPYRKSFSSCDVSHTLPSSPSSSTSTYAPHTPISSTTLPPSYTDSTYLDATASTPHHNLGQSSRVASWVTLPDMIIETSDDSKHASRPSSFLSYSFSVPPHVERSNYSHEEEDDLSITDAYMDSRPVSPAGRAQTPIPFTPSELPMPPPPALAFHRPFSPPSVYPVTQSHAARNVNAANGSTNGISVTVHTQSSRESL
ncbi:hypothetical protein DFJ43DRAFT_732143 [Lentinula guzmanii]|uniref:Uncharacterized protein n=1 Tax=Lentinula guzmanii TaxID=2804957 RepID=A0AA38JB55_9AGAR|nr:hypothetical protein DFJ43DRAFT_732143 [Lentinula guzmanii]